MSEMLENAKAELSSQLGNNRFRTILADPPWRFTNRTGKVAPEHKRLNRYPTMDLADICGLPISEYAEGTAHLYMWVPNALLPEGIQVLDAWGFQYSQISFGIKFEKMVAQTGEESASIFEM